MRRTHGQVIASLAGILATILMAIWVGASFVAERVTLHPKRWDVGPTPAQLGHAYQDIAFRDHAGLTLRGWWIPGTRHQTIVMIHGWTSSRREPMGKAGYLLDAGYNVLVFDLRGHGRSDGDYTTLGYSEPDDVATAVTFARSRDPGPIALFGFSMGGALAVETGARDAEVSAVVEDSGYGSVDNVFRAGFQRITGLPPIPFGLPLVAIGQVDLRVPIDRVRPVTDAARLRKPLLVDRARYERAVPSFLAGALG
jgi:pimeloyl-ACP methyl ester carboxylesterase